MMVGPSGSGKSSAWRVLLKALERLEGMEGVSHVIDPKVGIIHCMKQCLCCTYDLESKILTSQSFCLMRFKFVHGKAPSKKTYFSVVDLTWDNSEIVQLGKNQVELGAVLFAQTGYVA